MKIDKLLEKVINLEKQADSSEMTVDNPRDKRALKRDCVSDEDPRPAKVLKPSSGLKTKCSEDASTEISQKTQDENNSEIFAKPGCSKDINVYDESILTSDGSVEDDEAPSLPVELMSLSDDVLLIIMSYLKPTDLLNLSLCCQRLSQVAGDWSLWIKVNFRPHSLLSWQLKRFLPFLSDTTESIATRGFVGSRPLPRWRTECLTSELLTAISVQCPHLRSFTAEEHCIDANKLKISSFPPSLEYLSLRRSEVVNRPTDASYFNSMFHHLPHLKVLELSDCAWLPPHSIMALSKLPVLEELYLDGCHLVRDCIPYASLAFSLGFCKLKVLDLRRTGVSDSELSCINRSNRLTHLYLEYPSFFPNELDEESGGPHACHLPGIVSDRGLRSLVISDKHHVLINNAQFGIHSQDILVMAPSKVKVSLCQIHTLVARNFNLVTDATLNELHFVQSLRYLDLTGTQVSRQGIEYFHACRPEVKVVSSFEIEGT